MTEGSSDRDRPGRRGTGASRPDPDSGRGRQASTTGPQHQDVGVPGVAVLGTGAMGTAIATRLLDRGHPVTVWNRTEQAAADALTAGAIWAGSPAAAAAGADVVLLSVTDQAAAHAVLARVPRLQPLIDLTTLAPEDSRRNAAFFGPDRYVTSAIFATPPAAAVGRASVLSAGPAADTELLTPIWASICRRRTHLGTDHGRASGLKVLTNYLHLSAIAQLACAVAAGRAWGLDDPTIADWLDACPAVAASARPRLVDIVGGGRQDGYPQDHAADALRIAAEGARAVGVLLTGAEETRGLFARSAHLGTAGLDVSAVVRSVVDTS